MAGLKNTNRIALTDVAAWRDGKGRWHIVCDDPDVRGSSSEGLHVRVGASTKSHENLNEAYANLTTG